MRTFKLLVGATFILVSLMSSPGRAAEPGGDNGYPAATQQDPGIDEAAMAQWKRRGEEPDWMAEELAKHKVVVPADNKGLIGKSQGSTYGSVTPEDVKVWQQETYKLAVEGSRIFHSGDRLKSTIAVSCDMCHPDGANTHPETYPKFQVQLGRVALLRDAINWCIENPVRGKKLGPDSSEMRALETYIYAQRMGAPLEYGKR
ncbi:MAG: c-type cytochrome [Gammaproteobacteria bacterium]